MAVVAAQQNRGPGVVDTGTLDLAVVLGAPVQPNTLYIGTAIMDAADLADPTLTFPFQLWLDGQLVRDETWSGGVLDKNGNPSPPRFGWGQSGVDAVAMTTARIVLDLPKRIRIGLDVSTTSPVR